VTQPDLSPATKADARQRSFRSLLQGLGIDLLVALTLSVATLIGDLRWTREYWLLLGATVLKSVVQASASYVMRIYVKPSSISKGTLD
jgi:hypothetical protein